jgi:glycosyltransferase involved in cell wall biosynthesis
VDLVVVPIQLEFLGNVILKAMDTGVPVVAASGGAMSAALEDGISYVEFSPDDRVGLSAAIEAVLFDRGVRERVISGARQKVHDSSDTGRKLRQIYMDSVAGPREPAMKGGETGELRLSQPGGQGEV